MKDGDKYYNTMNIIGKKGNGIDIKIDNKDNK